MLSILAGRGFGDADAAEGSTAAIVDRTFAERMGGSSVVGRRSGTPITRARRGVMRNDRWGHLPTEAGPRCRSGTDHSTRIERIGSTDEARCAGTQLASTPTPSMQAVTTM